MQMFLKSLIENYSLPENLMEDIKEIVYEQELTHYENNNEFIAQLPLSPISKSSYAANSSICSRRYQELANEQFKLSQVTKNHEKNKKFIPILDFDKLKDVQSDLDYYEESQHSQLPDREGPQMNFNTSGTT